MSSFCWGRHAPCAAANRFANCSCQPHAQGNNATRTPSTWAAQSRHDQARKCFCQPVPKRRYRQDTYQGESFLLTRAKAIMPREHQSVGGFKAEASAGLLLSTHAKGKDITDTPRTPHAYRDTFRQAKGMFLPTPFAAVHDFNN